MLSGTERSIDNPALSAELPRTCMVIIPIIHGPSTWCGFVRRITAKSIRCRFERRPPRDTRLVAAGISQGAFAFDYVEAELWKGAGTPAPNFLLA